MVVKLHDRLCQSVGVSEGGNDGLKSSFGGRPQDVRWVAAMIRHQMRLLADDPQTKPETAVNAAAEVPDLYREIT
jgi:hypothetical protein